MCEPSKYTESIVNHITTQYPELKLSTKPSSINLPPWNMDYTDIYIYKHSHIKDVIDELANVPKSVIHWYQGKLYGISDAEIEEFYGRQ